MDRPEVIIVIIGPTSVGKSALAVELAHRIGGEVISADSRQVYAGLDIGTGKITKKEMRGVKHHLLGIKAPRTTYTAAQFARDAKRAICDIRARGKVPIICGGTGFYIDALVGRVPLAQVPAHKKLRAACEKKTAETLYAELRKKDPTRAIFIDRHNKRRLVRALEIAASGARAALSPAEQVPALWIGLKLPKEELRARIGKRLRERMKHGMVAEARRLHAAGLSYRRMKELGLEYKYLALLLEGSLTKEEMLVQLEAKIWQFAKRQTTYWRRNTDIQWFAPGDLEKILTLVAQHT